MFLNLLKVELNFKIINDAMVIGSELFIEDDSEFVTGFILKLLLVFYSFICTYQM